jgi:hypothetical protein
LGGGYSFFDELRGDNSNYANQMGGGSASFFLRKRLTCRAEGFLDMTLGNKYSKWGEL